MSLQGYTIPRTATGKASHVHPGGRRGRRGVPTGGEARTEAGRGRVICERFSTARYHARPGAGRA